MNSKENQEDKKGLSGPKILLFAMIGVAVTASMVTFGLSTGSDPKQIESPSVSSASLRSTEGFQPYKGDDSSSPPLREGERNPPPAPRPSPIEPPPSRPATPPRDDLSDSPPVGVNPPPDPAPRGLVEVDPRTAYERQRDIDEEEQRRLIDEERERHIKHFFGDDDPRKKVAPEKLELYKRLAEGPPRDLGDISQLVRDARDSTENAEVFRLEERDSSPSADVARTLERSDFDQRDESIELRGDERGEDRGGSGRKKDRKDRDDQSDEYQENQGDEYPHDGEPYDGVYPEDAPPEGEEHVVEE